MGVKQGAAGSLANLGLVAHEQGDAGRAAALLEESLALAHEEGECCAAVALSNLGFVAREQGDVERAVALQEEELRLDLALGNRHGAAASLKGMAGAVVVARRLASAARLYGAEQAPGEANDAPVPPGDLADYDRHVADPALSSVRQTSRPRGPRGARRHCRRPRPRRASDCMTTRQQHVTDNRSSSD